MPLMNEKENGLNKHMAMRNEGILSVTFNLSKIKNGEERQNVREKEEESKRV